MIGCDLLSLLDPERFFHLGQVDGVSERKANEPRHLINALSDYPVTSVPIYFSSSLSSQLHCTMYRLVAGKKYHRRAGDQVRHELASGHIPGAEAGFYRHCFRLF